MSFKTENRKISNIFESQRIYSVPRYQRGYVWENINWSELLNDIKFTIRENDTAVNWSHFFGAIVLNKKYPENNYNDSLGIESYEIIDGQQRLTTIFVIFIALCSRYRSLGSNVASSRADYIEKTYIYLTSYSDSEKIFKLDNAEITSDIKAICQSALDQTYIPTNSNKPIYKLFNFFLDEFKQYDFNQLEKFFSKLLSINIVEIISEEDEEIYNIFEVLNARGQKLLQMELLKNRVMKYITPREADVIDKAKETWKEIENNFTHTHLKDSDTALHHFVKCYIGKPQNKDSVYKLIKEKVDIDRMSDLLEALKNFSISYKYVTESPNENNYIRYFQLKNNRQISALLAALHIKLAKEFNSESLFIQTLCQLRNYFFIFNLERIPGNKIDKYITEYSFKIYNSSHKNELLIYVASLFSKLAELIELDNGIKKYLETNPSLRYSNKKNSGITKNGSLVKYILCEIYKKMQSDTQLNPDLLTIEHLNSDDGTENSCLLSNLTLLSKELNEKLGNKNPVEKIKVIKEESSIETNKTLDNFIIEGVFNQDSRMQWLSKELTTGNFEFKSDYLNITADQIKEYEEIEKIVKEDNALYDLLKELGTKFKCKLEKDPNLLEKKERYEELEAKYNKGKK